MAGTQNGNEDRQSVYLGLNVAKTSHERLSELAKKQETTVSALVRTAIRDYLAKPENKE